MQRGCRWLMFGRESHRSRQFSGGGDRDYYQTIPNTLQERTMTKLADLEIILQRREDCAYTLEMRFNRLDDDADNRLAPTAVQFDLPRLKSISPSSEEYGICLFGSLFAIVEARILLERARAFSQLQDAA